MGSKIEFNDTLKLSKERGFPADLRLEDHVANPGNSRRFLQQEFPFWNAGERLYHRPPTRVWLVEEIEGRWLYWGHAIITEQTIKDGRTEGKYRLIMVYTPDYQHRITIEESPSGKSYFSDPATSLQ